MANMIETAHENFRLATAIILVPAMRATGFRFSKDYRRGATYFHRAVYAMVDTVAANIKAGLNRDQFKI
jgi:hypothetical protein